MVRAASRGPGERHVVDRNARRAAGGERRAALDAAGGAGGDGDRDPGQVAVESGAGYGRGAPRAPLRLRGPRSEPRGTDHGRGERTRGPLLREMRLPAGGTSTAAPAGRWEIREHGDDGGAAGRVDGQSEVRSRS